MDSIGQLIPKVNAKEDSSTSRAALPDSQRKTMLVRRFGERAQFLTTFNPSYQREICTASDVCFFGDFPTLADIKAYGENFPIMWLMPQLDNLSNYCGCRDKLEGDALEECAFVITSEYYYLKISEIMLFLHRIKAGRYGHLYGSVDPLKIMAFLHEFIKERFAAYDKREREEREKQRTESRKNCITWEEYVAIYKPKDTTHPLERTPATKQVEPTEPRESILHTARMLLTDPLADESTKNQYIRLFEKKYGYTPQEYIDRYEEEQEHK